MPLPFLVLCFIFYLFLCIRAFALGVNKVGTQVGKAKRLEFFTLEPFFRFAVISITGKCKFKKSKKEMGKGRERKEGRKKGRKNNQADS